MTSPLALALALSLASPVASAQDGVDARHAPLPPDAEEADPALQRADPPPPPQATAEALEDARVDALMAFRNRHLAIRSYTSWRGGGATVVHGGWGWGGPYRGWGLGTSYVIREPREPVHDWAVFQGVQQLDVPGFLDVVGDDLRLAALQDDMRRANRNSRIGYGVGAAGLAATVAGFFGSVWAEDEQQLITWNTVSAGGICAALVGTIAGGSASSRAQRLQLDFRSTVGFEDSQRQVDAYNEQLRQELGLSKPDAYRVLTDEPPPRRRR
jgi:hypothetical protein